MVDLRRLSSLCGSLALLFAPPASAAVAEEPVAGDEELSGPKELPTLAPGGAEPVRARRSLEPEPARGAGLAATGLVLTTLGALVISGGSIILVNARARASDGHSPGGGVVVGLGVVLAGVGIPLTVMGVRQSRRWRAWDAARTATLHPAMGRSSAGTWTYGAGLRF